MKLCSLIKGTGFEDAHDVDEYLELPSMKWLKVSLVLGITAIIVIAVTALVS